MAAPADGAYGFKVADTTMITVGAVEVGFLEGSAVIRVPREYSFLNSDSYQVDFDHVMTRREAFLSFTTSEITLANLATAWDTNAVVASTLVVDKDVSASVLALVVTTKSPTGAGSTTRTITAAKGVPVGEGTYTLPVNEKQTIDMEFKILGDTASDGLLMTIVDS